MTAYKYYQWFRDCGYEPTGVGTLITQEWVNKHETYIMVTRAEELSASDRAATVERYKMYLGIGYPRGGPGVH